MKSSFSFSSQPRFVTSGDVNNDQQIDIVVMNSGTNTIGIFLGQGNGTFGKQQTYSTGAESSPRSVTINDFNNDSHADIVVANYNINSIGLFLGYGNGTFDEQKSISLASSHPLFVISEDFNNDNRMDIVVINNGTNSFSILLGYANGSFEQQMIYSTGYDSFPSSLAAGDFNNDTHQDIAVTNSGTNSIAIFLNYGNGTFKNQHIYPTTSNGNPSSIALAHFNNDNILDIVVANSRSGTVEIFLGQGNGAFLPQIPYLISSNARPEYLTVSNINQMNVSAIVIVDSKNGHIFILSGYENGRFETMTTYDSVVGSRPLWITGNDLNNNNQTDFIVVNYDTNNVLVLMDYFSKPSVRQTNYHGKDLARLTNVAVYDFNDDGIIDIVFIEENYLGILIGRGDATFDQGNTYTIDGK